MNKRTRNFMVGSTAIVLFGLCTGLVAFYNGGLPLMSSSRGPSELAYLPADSVMVGYANVREVMNSEFRQKLNAVIPSGEGQDEFMRETGIDIEHDIDTVVAGASAGEPDEHGIVLFRGRFNDGQIEGLIRSHGGTVEEYKGIRIVIADPVNMAVNEGHDVPRDLANVNPADRSFALAFLESGLLGAGKASNVKAAIDAKQSGQNATTNDALMGYINDVQTGQSAWAVGRFDAISQTDELPDQIKQHLPAVQWFSVTSRINGGVSGAIRADTTDEVAAENLRDVVRGGLAMGRLFSGEDQRMKMLLDSLQMSGTGKTVAVSFSVSPEMIDVLAGLASLSASPSQNPLESAIR
jgi:hypothetical protein